MIDQDKLRALIDANEALPHNCGLEESERSIFDITDYLWNNRAAILAMAEERSNLDDRPDIQGAPKAKIMGYNDLHEDAVRLGYPSILEALEDVERMREALEQAAHNLEAGDRLYSCPGLHEAAKLARRALDSVLGK